MSETYIQTVEELIEALKELPGYYRVHCFGEVGVNLDVVNTSYGHFVTITPESSKYPPNNGFCEEV